MGIDLSPGASVALGILVGLVSTCVQSIGLTQQRKSHLLEEQKLEEDGDHVSRPAYRRRRWQLGMLMFLVSNIVGSSIQITTLPLPVLSTLQASGLVFNTICATVVLGEPFTKYSLVGTLLVAAGAALIGVFGSVTEPSHSLRQLLMFLGRWNFLVWLSATFLIVVILAVSMFILRRIHPRQTHRVRLVRGMSFGAISGILSAHTLLLAKSAVELLVRTIVDKINQFNQWQSWMILVGLVVLALAQLYYLHRGLKLVSTSVLYPFVFCVYNVIAILDGLIYFDQGSRLPLRDALLIAVGTVVLLGGVFALSWRLQADDDLPGPSAVDVKAKARVVTPRTILQPGLGIEPDSEDEDIDEESPFIRPADDDEALRSSKHLHHPARPSETTPLLRTKTGPMRPQPYSEHKDPALRPPKLRRMTTIRDDDTIDLWDELNDRPVSASANSPTTPRSGTHQRRSVSGASASAGGFRRSRTTSLSTMQQRRRSSLRDYASMSWRYFSGGDGGAGGDDQSRDRETSDASPSSIRKKKRVQAHDFGNSLSPPPAPVSEAPTTDEDEEGEGGLEHNPWRNSFSGGQTRARARARTEGEKLNWFQLQRWWKKRWRGQEDDDDAEGGGEARR